MRGELDQHAQARAVWAKKPVLQIVYTQFFDKIISETVTGAILEIGGGNGWFKDYRPDVISSDLHPSPNINFVANAERLPIADNSFENIVMLDVLHHVPVPRRALQEAERVLKVGGRLIMLEPGISPGSYLFYKFLHPEPLKLAVDPLSEKPLSTMQAYDSNQAIPTRLVGRVRRRLSEVVPHLTLIKSDWMSLVAYPLSGGLRSWSLIPAGLAPGILWLEDRVPKALRRFFGFRVLIVLEKTR